MEIIEQQIEEAQGREPTADKLDIERIIIALNVAAYNISSGVQDRQYLGGQI